MGVVVKDSASISLKAFAAALPAKAQRALNMFGFSVLAFAQARSPVDTGRFKNAWQAQAFKDGGSVAGIEVTNNVVYSWPLEYGSPVGGTPWSKPGPKTVLYEGRIWSSQAPGGVVSPHLEELAKNAAALVLKEL